MFACIPALMLLLLAPGPTNTLLFRAGVLFGYRASWWLAFVECLAYVLQVSIWGVALLYLAAYSPWASKFTQLAAAGYLLYVSYKLWQRKNSTVDPGRDRLSGLSFFWLTLMNPKGLLIVSFIAPAGTFAAWQGYAGFMATLVLVVIPVGSAWIVFGSRFEGLQKAWLTPLKINRATALAMGGFATLTVGRLAESVLH